MAILHMSVYDPKTLERRPEIQKRAQDQLRFFLELEEQYFLGSREMLRKAGLKVPVSGTNWQGGASLPVFTCSGSRAWTTSTGTAIGTTLKARATSNGASPQRNS